MEPRFFGQSEAGDWMSLGVLPDLCSDSVPITMDVTFASEVEQELPLPYNLADDSTFPPPETLEDPNEFPGVSEHVNSYTTNLEPIFNWEFFEPEQPL